jgi:hypothetical protein
MKFHPLKKLKVLSLIVRLPSFVYVSFLSVHGSVLTSASQSVCLSVGQCGTQVNIKALFFAHSAAKNLKISNLNILKNFSVH